MSKEGFFDFRRRITEPAAPTPTGALTVAELTGQIDRALKTGLPATVRVKGEVSNCNRHRGSGHIYFTLKDTSAAIDCVMFRSDAAKLQFDPEDGLELIASGRVGIYPQRGRYQLYVTALTPLGRGALELAFQQLRERLQKLGLFEQERKKQLPRFPNRITLITSKATAALQDMLKVFTRTPWIHVDVVHTPVQGDGSAELIAAAIQDVNRAVKSRRVDLIILARGGGSLEDLWEFNEEIVAHAIAASGIPVITGIGHEINVSIADLVADYHAHTPTEAAQVAIAHWKTAVTQLEQFSARLVRGMSNLLDQSRQQLMSLSRHEFFRRPTDRLNQLRQLLDDRERTLQFAAIYRQRRGRDRLNRVESLWSQLDPRHRVNLLNQKIDQLETRMNLGLRHDLQHRIEHITALERHLTAISPGAVLRRGYSITTVKKTGSIVRSPAQMKRGDRIITRLADGEIESVVEDQHQLPLFE